MNSIFEAMKLQRYSRQESIDLINQFGRTRSPFLFLISFSGEGNIIVPEDEAAGGGFNLDMPGLVNHKLGTVPGEAISFTKLPVDRDRYSEAFSHVKDQILYGNSFLLNLLKKNKFLPTHFACYSHRQVKLNVISSKATIYTYQKSTSLLFFVL